MVEGASGIADEAANWKNSAYSLPLTIVRYAMCK